MFIFLFSCSLSEKASVRSPALILDKDCLNSLRDAFKKKTLFSKNIWQRIIRRRPTATFNITTYEAALQKLEALPLSEIQKNYSYFGEDIEFEEVLAFVDIVVKKTQGPRMESNGLRKIIDDNYQKAHSVLVDLKNKFDNDYSLTYLEVRRMMAKYTLLTLGPPPSVWDGLNEAFYDLAYRSFLYRVTTKSLKDLFAHEKFKSPLLIQKTLDQMFRLYRSRVSTLGQNVIYPILSIKSGIVPFPVKRIDFYLHDDLVEDIWKNGFHAMWPHIRKEYRGIGYSTLSFNQFARIYAPIGLMGYMLTTYLYYAREDEEADEDKAMEFARNITISELENQ